MILLLLLVLWFPSLSSAATYYISPTGSNGNAGTSEAAPWLTFAYAIANSACGDSILLLDGTYGDGTSTGKISLNGRVCSQGLEFAFIAFNQRKAKIFDNGTSIAVNIVNSAYITIDGLLMRSTDNSGATGGTGRPFQATDSHHLILRNNVFSNPNRYGNTGATTLIRVTDALLEDNETYVFHRHCVTAIPGERIVVRRQYCNPRGGRISGGYNEAAGLGGADALFSMYPCKDCILENSIADGTTHRMYLNEENATFSGSILMSGAKVLGSICYKCDYGNGIFLSGRLLADINHTPQNITVRDVAMVDHASTANAIRSSDGINIAFDHLSILGTGVGLNGFVSDDSATGATGAALSFTVKNSIVTQMSNFGFRNSISGATWSGNYLTAYNNGTNFSPALPSNWGTTSTSDPDLGTCKLWTPDGSANKGTGENGSDRGATILYRYVNGVLTNIPLWDPTTGAFPYGEADADGLNRVSGQSLFDIHTRLNVHTGGCSFPAGYGTGGGGGGASTVVKGTTAASGLTTTATPLTWDHTITASQDRLLACVGLWHSGFNVGSVSGIDVSGQAMSLVKRQVSSPDAYRAVEMWELASPTNGLRTITVTLTGNISGALGRSMEFDATSGLNTATGASTAGTGTSLSVTALTNTNELVTDCTVSSKSVTFTHGTDQIGYDSLSHDTQSLRLEASTQNGSAGGVMSNSTGGAVLQAKVAVSLIAGTPDPSSGAVLTGTQYQIFNGFGHEDTVAQAAAKNTQARIGPEGFARIRGEIEASVAVTEPFTPALYCNKNGGAYAAVADTFGSNIFRYYGAGPESTDHPIPATGSGTIQKLNTGQFLGGVVLRDSTTAYVVPALSPGQRVELEAAVQFNGAANDVVNCRWYNSNGTALAYGANGTASILITPAGAVAGY